MAWHSSTSAHAKRTIIPSLPLRISCNQQSEEEKEQQQGQSGMSPAGCKLQSKPTWARRKKKHKKGRASKTGWFKLKIELMWLFQTTFVVILNVMQENILKNPGNPDKGATQSSPTVLEFWRGSASPAEVLMLLGLEQTVGEPSCQKWALPRGTATDPCYWLWQSCHSGWRWAFHTQVGGTATHPNLTQLELILWRADDG